MSDHKEPARRRVSTGREDMFSAIQNTFSAEKNEPCVDAIVDRVDISPVNRASRPFVNGGKIDICEIPIVTFLQAVAFNKEILLLPITALGRTQHQTLVTLKGLTVNELEGSTVGVRSWSQTTGVWVRGFLSEDYGINLQNVDWRTYEDGHIDEFCDPDWTVRNCSGTKLPQDFLNGHVDFAILGNELPPEAAGVRTAIPNAREVGVEWSQKHGCVPVNHIFAVDRGYASKNPSSVLKAYDAMIVAARKANTGPIAYEPFGAEAMRGPISLASKFAFEQGVIPHPVSYDDLLSETCETLGVPLSRLLVPSVPELEPVEY